MADRSACYSRTGSLGVQHHQFVYPRFRSPDLAGPSEELASLIPGAQALPIPRRDHMLAVGDRAYKAGVLAFLQQRP